MKTQRITVIPLILLFVVSTVFRGYSSSCSWDPSNTDTIEVGASVTIQAQPGDPAPNNQGHCACDSQNTSVDWAPTGNWRVSYGGAADSGGTLDTSTSGDKTVEASIEFEYECSETSDTKWVDDSANPWTKVYKVGNYYIEGPSTLDHETAGTFEAKASGGGTADVTGWDAGDGTVSGSGASVSVTWDTPGQKTLTATIQGYGTVTLGVDVMGSIDVSIASPSDPAIVAVDEPVTFEAADPTGGDGNYTYEWSFENGKAPAGASTNKKVEGVKFGSQASGKENTVTLVVRDGTGNSGSASIKVVLANVAITEVAPESRVLCNSSSFFDLQTDYYSADLTVSVGPSARAAQIRPDVLMVVSRARPDTSDKGLIFSAAFQYDGSPFSYAAKEETRDMKRATNDNLKPQELIFDLKLFGSVADQETFTILSVFEYLKVQASDYDEAIRYSALKYDVQMSATYDPSLTASGATYSLTLATKIGPDGMRTENVCASTLIHEQVHHGQGSPMLYRMGLGASFWDARSTTPLNAITKPYVLEYAYGELEAYYTELVDRSHTEISQSEISMIERDISDFEDIIEAVE